jgi:chemosensory pili system protein ChpA (sensor histidine kinase/response regulator)
VVHAATQQRDFRAAPPGGVLTIVDDDDEMRAAPGGALMERGYGVSATSDGQPALARLEQGQTPDAIFLDLWIPVMNGRELVRAVSADRERRAIPRVVLTSARGQRARDLDVAEVLMKPVRLEQVLGVAGRLTAE